MSALMPLVPLFDYATLDKEVCVPHPVTGLLSYGYIEPYSSRNLTLPGGEIYLRVGKHHGFSKGFGVRHIWEGHGHELVGAGCPKIEDVPAFVAAILSQGAQILCEGYQTRDGYRLTIVRGAKGVVILSPQLDAEGENFYSVVTAYKVLKKQSAMKVGTLKAKKAP
ncbi:MULTISPECIES: hypothetical protein [unclassified Pseudomonas]|uniref:hypothetical protein n=1 Tax=unclassified Pseudomonas TaxID=196821 RepID=UPI00210DB85F|nr:MULTISPECIES: hypothetical protein [unclassified Pseudomonas]